MTERKSPARYGYEAYGDAAGWETFDGRPMPVWDDLPERTRNLWATAVVAAAPHVLRAAGHSTGGTD